MTIDSPIELLSWRLIKMGNHMLAKQLRGLARDYRCPDCGHADNPGFGLVQGEGEAKMLVLFCPTCNPTVYRQVEVEMGISIGTADEGADDTP